MLDVIARQPEIQTIFGKSLQGAELESLGIIRSARLPVLGAIHDKLNQPILLITEKGDRALELFDELSFWIPKQFLQLYPEPNPLFYEQAAWGPQTRRDRLQTLTKLSAYHILGLEKPEIAPIIVASVRALMARTLPRRDFIKASKYIKVGQSIQMNALKQHWVEIGYNFSDIVVEPGQFSSRGGILDIWPISEERPVRFDFFGDEVDSIRQFEPADQLTIMKRSKVFIPPAREVLPGYAEKLNIPQGEITEYYLPVIHPTPASLLDYLPKTSIIILDDIDLIATTANEIESQSVRSRIENISDGLLDEKFPVPYVSWSELEDRISDFAAFDFGYSLSETPSSIAELFQPGPRFGGRVKQVMDFIQGECAANHQVLVVSRQLSRLKDLWEEQRCENSGPQFIEGSLSEGFIFESHSEQKTILLTDSEIFGWDRPQSRKRSRPISESPESNYADLKTDDWVVHVDYGIGRYKGLVRRILEGVEREFLCVEYGGGDQLYVPVHQADRLGRYIGTGGSQPTPTRLGTPDWSQTKKKVREAVLEVAQDLLDLYAKRQLAVGTQFLPDNLWQKELEASFPYVETEDQMKAILAVKKDMESSRPMDRLLCGDVGYGKTEVALRAAFKAVLSGKQVAILVPTTVLAQQHYDTFKQRLAAYPVQVEMLSRFRNAQEQEDIILKLMMGEIDIIIGTHRLLQGDVQFKDLGLVVIDEEQRFGVTHKEYFKKMRTELDVLTLTATPIPRTLYMALTGVRDISVINSPPAERLPITTHIGPYSPKIVRQAILREIERGGQVFFVHNRVQTIRAMEKHLNMLVPEARIGVGHGQLPEGALSKVMKQFNAGEIDVLLCTTIIESGLDIPNANTLIVDRGDAFGLAQLYQLRGRVGRGAQRAYAYFFRHRKKAPTPEGQERLETIAENTQLGSGYSIAMRDLEMRGAGELLGTQQHGMIESVGFQLYTRLLAQAVGQIKNLGGISSEQLDLTGFKEIKMAVNVELPLSVGIPVDYISDQNLRLSLYRRIADINDEIAVTSMEDEFQDRFGELPEAVKNLMFQIRVKLLAEQIGLSTVNLEGSQIVLRFPPLPEGVQARDLPFINKEVRSGKNAYWLAFHPENEKWKSNLLQILSDIINVCRKY